jgi:hypothetical protein
MVDLIIRSCLILLFFSYAWCNAMEEEIPLVNIKKKRSAALHFNKKKDCLLTKLPPEVTSYIFSFLPADSLELNFLMHLKEFQPNENPLGPSPFLPIAESIQQAHQDYVVGLCRKGASTHKIREEVEQFMKPVRPDELQTFFWSDVQALEHLIPNEHVHADKFENDYEDLAITLNHYVSETKEINTQLQRKCHKDNYVRARYEILTQFSNRIRNNPYWEDLKYAYSPDNLFSYDPDGLFDTIVIGNHQCSTLEGLCGRAAGLDFGSSGCCMLTTGLLAGLHWPWIYPAITALTSLACCIKATALLTYINWAKQKYGEQEPDRDTVIRTYSLLFAARIALRNLHDGK